MAERDYSADEFPSPERRTKLRRDALKLARRFPPGPERNSLRLTAKTLAFFDDVAGSEGNAGKNQRRPGLPDQRGLRHGRWDRDAAIGRITDLTASRAMIS